MQRLEKKIANQLQYNLFQKLVRTIKKFVTGDKIQINII